MRSLTSTVLAASLLATAGCGFLSAAADMTNTTTPASTGLYDRLEKAAIDRGYTARRSEGKTPRPWDSFDLEVSPSAGEKLIYTKNNRTGNMAYSCDGPKLDEQKACTALANQLYGDAQK